MSRLIITRRAGTSVQIGPDVTVTLLEVKGQSARIAIDAPPHVQILRDDAITRDPKQAREPAATSPAVAS